MRKLTLAVLLLLPGLLSFAGDITQPQALKIAQSFLRSNVTAMKSQQKGGSDALKLVYTADDTKGRSCVYVSTQVRTVDSSSYRLRTGPQRCLATVIQAVSTTAVCRRKCATGWKAMLTK